MEYCVKYLHEKPCTMCEKNCCKLFIFSTLHHCFKTIHPNLTNRTSKWKKVKNQLDMIISCVNFYVNIQGGLYYDKISIFK